jgi:hypothetical protein
MLWVVCVRGASTRQVCVWRRRRRLLFLKFERGFFLVRFGAPCEVE